MSNFWGSYPWFGPAPHVIPTRQWAFDLPIPLQWGLEQIKPGRIKPLFDRALPLSEAAEAHRLIANNEVKGNIVLLPWAE